jgi:hypothetical protein
MTPMDSSAYRCLISDLDLFMFMIPKMHETNQAIDHDCLFDHDRQFAEDLEMNERRIVLFQTSFGFAISRETGNV